MSRPSPTPKAIASLVATSAVAERKLLASFIACASPGRSPTRCRQSLRPASTGSTCAHASSVAAYITASVRARAPGDAARDRRVDVGDAVVGEQSVDDARAAATPDRRRVDDVRRDPVVARLDELPGDRLRRSAVGQAAHDHAGARAPPRRSTSTCVDAVGRARRRRPRRGRRRRTPHPRGSPPARSPCCRARRPRPCSRQPPSRSASRRARITRRAESPAGPPQ